MLVRHLFLSLLTINVAFFGWARWIDHPRDASVAVAPTSKVPSLELTELPPTPSAPVTAPTHCRSIGPFPDATAASTLADALRTHGLAPRFRNVESSVPDGFWVYVEDLKDAAARRKVISTLNAAGMRDAAPMPDESDRVSVGVFNDQKHAVHRAEQVQELGFKPVLSVHQRPVTTPWLDVDLKSGDPDPSTGGGDSVKVIDCPLKSASG
jgi:hypothetical protein